MNYDINELYHHGVTGMKWGKRNGPPYPSNAKGKASLAKQKKASNRVSSGDTEGKAEPRSQKLDSKSKEDYKMHKEYNKQRAHKAVRRDVAVSMLGAGAVGTIAGGPIAGVASMLATGLATTAFSSAVNAGRNAVSNSKYKKMLLTSQEVKNAAEKGEAILNNSNQKMSTSKEQYMKTRNSFATDEHKDKWEHYMDLANDSSKTKAQRTKAAEYAQKIVDVDKRNKNYKSPYKEQYSVTFLEAIQNKEILELNDTKSIDAEYAKYKQNPEKYFTEDVKKLKDI